MGHWVVEPHNSPFEVPNDDFSPAHYAETTITFSHGESPDDVWELLLQVRDDIAEIANTLPHDLFFNSNSYANTLLAAVGVATQNFIPYPAAVDWAFMSNSIPKLRVYLCPPGNQTHERRLVFRDYRRRNDDVAKECSFLKRRPADQRLAGTVPI
ncbi:hypothetical protein [Rhizobium sp. CF122]|uniref:hypothetical protein n=1 Tax=Rhizobium sp. CF122 TaxID=1144312 RepID=UPI0012F76A48|nr:hypothetical protein [Rhizobium sp. CF122]